MFYVYIFMQAVLAYKDFTASICINQYKSWKRSRKSVLNLGKNDP